MFKPKKVSDVSTSYRKVLLYAHHGWGKTTQAKYYAEKYGKGFIISGESGLSSIRSTPNIDYLPFSSYDGLHDPSKDVYSFRGICQMIASPEFAAEGYQWIMLDSLTELSDMTLDHIERELQIEFDADPNPKKKMNNFKLWSDYRAVMLGACKWIRDLPYHVIVTCLSKEDADENGDIDYWPMVNGNQVQKQLPGIFDCVLCGVRITKPDGEGNNITLRFIVTDEYKGWHGKVRDENRRLKPVEKESNIVELFNKMDMSEKEFAALSESK